MTMQIATCLAILAGAIVLFSWDRIEADVVAIGVMIAVTATGLVSPDKAFLGFGSGTVIMILGFFIMTATLSHTGIVDTVGRWILTHVGNRPTLLMAVVMVRAVWVTPEAVTQSLNGRSARLNSFACGILQPSLWCTVDVVMPPGASFARSRAAAWGLRPSCSIWSLWRIAPRTKYAPT